MVMKILRVLNAAALTIIALSFLFSFTQAQTLPSETPKDFKPTNDGFEYVRRDVMIPMRDGVKLHTVIIVPKGARNAPILLTRTPYNASDRAERSRSTRMVATLAL